MSAVYACWFLAVNTVFVHCFIHSFDKLNCCVCSLYLNVFMPANTTASAALPVMVFFYGGGFLLGGINLPLYQATTFVSQQPVVMVTVNYRLASDASQA